MSTIAELAEQHIRESESHLRRIDELMAQARLVAPKGGAQMEAQLRKIQLDRDRLAQELDGIRRLPLEDGTDVVKRGGSLRDVLETIGTELEKVLATVFEREVR